MQPPVLESVLTCPQCGFTSQETMPEGACRYFHGCARCGALLRPNPGDCCVFCSFGSVKCPPVQLRRGCCDWSLPSEFHGRPGAAARLGRWRSL